MIALLSFLLALLVSPFKSRSQLEAENAALRRQLIVLRRKVRGRAALTNADRWFLVQLYQWFPSILRVLTIVRPETLLRWHRAGFRRYWRWKSRRGGRPQVHSELRALIRRMSLENPLWGAPRIHGEMLKLGFEVSQSSVAKYMVRRRGPPSQKAPDPRGDGDARARPHLRARPLRRSGLRYVVPPHPGRDRLQRGGLLPSLRRNTLLSARFAQMSLRYSAVKRANASLSARSMVARWVRSSSPKED